MAEVRWARQASADLEAIAEFIALDSFHYASLFAVDVIAVVERLAVFPLSGRMVPELNEPTIREAVMGNYRIVYRTKPELIEILTVYHGARLMDPSRLV